MNVDRAKLPRGVDQDWCADIYGCGPKNVPDKAAIAHVRPRTTDRNHIIGGGDIDAGIKPEGVVAGAADIVDECPATDTHICTAVGGVAERTSSEGRVLDTSACSRAR